MKCFILAAGFGKRMGELTKNLPKPLLKISDKTLLDLTIENCMQWGCDEFIINTHYLAEKIHSELKEKYSHLKIHVSHEKEKILGTGGGLKTGIDGIVDENEIILSINPDVILKPDLKFNPFDYINFQGDILLFLASKKESDSYTSLNLKNGSVSFEEGNFFYTGLSLIKVKALKNIPINEYYDLSDTFRILSKSNILNGILFSGQVVDVGDKEKYNRLCFKV